jgi:hemoglobin
MKLVHRAAAGLLAAGLLASSIACSSMSGSMHKASLYDRLGGSYAIAGVVDDLCTRLLADPVITANKQVVAHLPPEHLAGLKFLITEQICAATGGPQTYTGKSMKESHKGLMVSEAEWAAMAKDFQATLDKFKVPAAEQKELFDIVGTLKADIVEKPAMGESY